MTRFTLKNTRGAVMSSSYDFGTKIGKYTIVKCIGKGGFGSIYLVCAHDSDQAFAMKVDNSPEKRSLKQESQILQTISGSNHFPRLIEYNDLGTPCFLVQELLGPSLSSVRKLFPSHKLSMGSSLLIGIQMLKAIREFHKHNLLHNDIKPSNFLIRPNHKDFLCLIDFGLSTKIPGSDDDKYHGSTKRQPFRGTKIYSSPNAHLGLELSFRDDMYCWFYSVMELATGPLPWSHERESIPLLKAKNNVRRCESFAMLPDKVQKIYDEITNLGGVSTPKYQKWMDDIESVFEEGAVERPSSFEWEELDICDEMKISFIPLRLREGRYAIEPDFFNIKQSDDGELIIGFGSKDYKQKKFHPISKTCLI